MIYFLNDYKSFILIFGKRVLTGVVIAAHHSFFNLQSI